VRHPLKIRRQRKRKRKRSEKRNERRAEGRAMSLGKREGSGKRKRKKAAATVGMAVAVARAEVVTTVDKATGRADVKREEMRGAEVEEGTTAAGRLSDHLLTLRTLRQIELAPSDIAVIVLTIIGAIVDRMTMMQLQIRDQTAIAQPTFTIGNHRSRLLRFGTQFVFHEL